MFFSLDADRSGKIGLREILFVQFPSASASQIRAMEDLARVELEAKRNAAEDKRSRFVLDDEQEKEVGMREAARWGIWRSGTKPTTEPASAGTRPICHLRYGSLWNVVARRNRRGNG